MSDVVKIDEARTARAVEELIARAEISEVLQRYVRGIDRFDLDLVASCYHPGAYDDHGLFRGPAAEFVAWLRPRLGRHAATTHFLSVSSVRLTSPDVAQVQTNATVHQLSQPGEDGQRQLGVSGIRYLDRFERRDGAWKIAHRRVAHDWRCDQTVGPEPGDPSEDDTRGRRDRTDLSYTDTWLTVPASSFTIT